MMKKWGMMLMAMAIFSTACKSDDNGYRDLPREEQDLLDDQAIVQYLEDHYFDPDKGLIEIYDEENDEDDDYPSLKSMAVKLPSGVWIVKRPGVIAEGPKITNNLNDSILISYNSVRFKASDEDLVEGQRLYAKNFGSFYNTIYSTGSGNWDPPFYYKRITKDLEERKVDIDFYVIEGFVEGLKEFASVQNSGADLYNFQGAILVPSRLAYARDFVYLNGSLDANTYRDNSFVFNFELHRVVPRNE